VGLGPQWEFQQYLAKLLLWEVGALLCAVCLSRLVKKQKKQQATSNKQQAASSTRNKKQETSSSVVPGPN
jgi:hypothetical protein